MLADILLWNYRTVRVTLFAHASARMARFQTDRDTFSSPNTRSNSSVCSVACSSWARRSVSVKRWQLRQPLGFLIVHRLHKLPFMNGPDISKFDPKAPPPKTRAFWEIVDANRAPEDAGLADALDFLKNPNAITLGDLTGAAQGDTIAWLHDRKNRRAIPHRLESCGYVPLRNDTAKDGYWVINGKRQPIYALKTLSIRAQIEAAKERASR
jgi:hypothetical protein